MRQIREMIACGLWTAAVAMMTFGTIDSVRDGHTSAFLAWGVFLAVTACVPTGWCIVKRESIKREEVTLDHVIEVVDVLHRQRELTRIR